MNSRISSWNSHLAVPPAARLPSNARPGNVVRDQNPLSHIFKHVQSSSNVCLCLLHTFATWSSQGPSQHVILHYCMIPLHFEILGNASADRLWMKLGDEIATLLRSILNLLTAGFRHDSNTCRKHGSFHLRSHRSDAQTDTCPWGFAWIRIVVLGNHWP